jgi:hypothetical protein
LKGGAEEQLPADLLVTVDGNNSLKRMAFGDKQTRSFDSKFRLPETHVDRMRVEQEQTKLKRLEKAKGRLEQPRPGERSLVVGYDFKLQPSPYS